LEEINALFNGFAVAMTPFNLLLMLVGVTLGVIIGVLPGLGGANGIAILLPLTFTMPPTSAIIMLSCIYWGALFGGAITSILFNIPGEPWSVATTFDGYPMARNGKAGEALTAAFTSSFIGAFFAIVMITFLAPLVAKFALQFGPPEFFSVYLLTFCSFVGMNKAIENRVCINLRRMIWAEPPRTVFLVEKSDGWRTSLSEGSDSRRLEHGCVLVLERICRYCKEHLVCVDPKPSTLDTKPWCWSTCISYVSAAT
jgi:hypothetical protein